MSKTVPLALALASLLAILAVPPALRAQAVTDQWNTIVVPTAPPISPVTLDPKTTALMVMDFTTTGCSPERRPRCVAALPHVRALLAAARAHGVFVVFTTAGTSTVADMPPGLTPLPGDPVVKAGLDKFIQAPSLLETFTRRSIVTVITAGTSGDNAVMHTAAGAAMRGFHVVVPVDAMPSDSAFAEGYAVWHLVHAPRVADVLTLTKTDEITFAP